MTGGEPFTPSVPYAGTSGWSGSDTSRERAERDDADGTTSARQRKVLAALAEAGEVGMTWNELAYRFGWHHGAASGVLSVLHRDGRIARLAERRRRMKVYVAVQHVAGRTTEAHGRKAHKPSPCPNCGHQEATA